ncbi:MAG: hypothetical protein RXQ56_05230 [Thermoproteus sp.]|jgi:hypothetical protein|uniref:hypothetical protein n=1 Tax=Thermoproteus sp. CP80 TaxID=1650659 RepID=UPI000747050B|nr:hypothetical protein [Thermoproteus sp. CP80]KUO85499.1 MAG: hypothetical protein AT711_00370 [Thermoproteus sp. CIS_19]KUO88571.1 MAG: hypothetical protein AT715_01645 [Thermoproteus sp. JCHS_4]MDT7869695.1 hypothetical protein [Thermoproteus sp.]MDT7881341.1 hypothetical protein [Thermoproteus sp.]PLC67094.1 hypothetical protein B7L68_00875 [Thermoproteus sp. CP80]
MVCERWERLMQHAERQGNREKALGLKEKLVECLVYRMRSLIAERRLDEAEALIKQGRDLAKRYGIEELSFHLDLGEREIRAIRERRAKAAAQSS